MTDVKDIDIAKIIKRLELIKSLISLEEEPEIIIHVDKLLQQVLTSELKNIAFKLKEKYYYQAIIAIDTFIKRQQELTKYVDPEIDALKLEINSLELEINSLSYEKADLEKLIHEFGVRHNKELGALINKILQQRKEKAKGTRQEQEAEEDYNTYQHEYKSTKDAMIFSLSKDELKELKDKYRKASKLCHPDVVSEEQKDLATKLFAELSAAYEKNDLEKVIEILASLETGHFFCSKFDTINEKSLLQTEVEKLRLCINELNVQLLNIKESDAFKKIRGINNWDEYFSIVKQELMLQINDF